VYIQLYLDYLEDKDPTTVKMFLNPDFNLQMLDTETLDFRQLGKDAWIFIGN